ncbi:RNA-splicing ligase RtcB [Manis javanica]|nr:RNA-splicing ligase RtcB [Manis javanica]
MRSRVPERSSRVCDSAVVAFLPLWARTGFPVSRLGAVPVPQDSVGIQDLGAGWGRAGPLTHFFLSEDSAVAGPGGAGRPETESRCGFWTPSQPHEAPELPSGIW